MIEEIKRELKDLVAIWHEMTDLDFKLQIAIQYLELRAEIAHMLQDDISSGVPDHEIWRNCYGWEDLYQISNYGRIKGVETFYIKTTKGRTMSVFKSETIRRPNKHQFGYPQISFWRDERITHYSCHRLVGIHFIPNPNNYPQVLHKDDNPLNPRWNNLFWGTQKHNIQDCINKGRWHIGSKNGNSKLREEQIPIIRKMLSERVSERKIAAEFKVCRYAISAIRRGLTWKNN